MDELDDDRIVDEVAQGGLHPFGPGRKPFVAHFRPAVEGIAGVEPGDIGAEQELEEEQAERPDRDERHAHRAGGGIAGEGAQIRRRPDQAGEDQQAR